MPRRSRLLVVKRDVLAVFEDRPQRVYTRGQLSELLQEHAAEWRLPKSVTGTQFIRFLLEYSPMHEAVLVGPGASNPVRYLWGEDVSPFEIGLSLREDCYLSHGSAVFLHGLTQELPKTIYINTEQTPKPRGGSLSQERIDNAFRRPQRTSSDVLVYGDYRFTRISGKSTGRLEVGTVPGPQGQLLETTKVERTLIDITVRPAYAGGVSKVLEAFETAREYASVSTLLITLKKLDYVYPFHQAIGFYMQRAGYPERWLERLRQLGMEFDFYLTYAMKEMDYIPEWRLFIPKGM